MPWLKRNLFLAVSGLLAVLLLGFGLYYFWTSRQKNKTVEAQLEETKTTYNRLVDGSQPYPNATNIARAKEELERVRTAINQARQHFQPVPFEPVTGLAFKTLLDTTLYDLHKSAETNSVILPSKNYGFTFEHQKRQLQFPPEAFPALPQQLAEIKLICDTLFSAKINKLITFRRSRLYADEPVSQFDHHDMRPELDEAMGIASNPYEIVFHAFSSELATVLQAFYKSTNGLVVKSVAVDVAPLPTADPNVPLTAAPAVQPGFPGGAQPAAGQQVRPPPTRPGVPVAAGKPADGGLKTVLNEKLLKITMVIEVLRTVPTKT